MEPAAALLDAQEGPSLTLDLLDLAIASVFLADYVLHLYIAKSRRAYLFSWTSFIDVVTILPAFLEVGPAPHDWCSGVADFFQSRADEVTRAAQAQPKDGRHEAAGGADACWNDRTMLFAVHISTSTLAAEFPFIGR